MSPNMKIDSDKLVEETIEYFRNYNLNGITGSLTLFGDLALNTAVQVELIDERNPSKRSLHHGRGNNYIRGEWVSSEDYNTI